MVSGEQDFTKRSSAVIDHRKIKGVDLITPTVAGCLPISIEHIVKISHEQILGTALKTPTFAQCVPTSIENTAIAYDVVNDRFKVDVAAMSVGTIGVDVSDEWTRQLGLVDLSRVLGAALSHANPVIVRLTDGSAWIDPRDVSDRAARLLGVVYGSLDKLQQQATTKELLVQIAHQGVIKDPTQIRTLTSTDVVKAYGSQTQALLQRAATYDLIVQLRHAGAEIDPTQIRTLTSSDTITAVQPTAANLNATVTQAEKDRTITDISKVATAQQISNTWTGAGNYTVRTPASGKKIRLKFISLELSANVDLGYRFGAAGTIFYLRTTAGPYVSNLIACNNEGAADAALILYASGACTVKGYCLLDEV